MKLTVSISTRGTSRQACQSVAEDRLAQFDPGVTWTIESVDVYSYEDELATSQGLDVVFSCSFTASAETG